MTNESEVLPDAPLQSLLSLLRDKFFEKYEIKVTNATSTGQNYSGVLYRVTVEGENVSGDITLNFIVKVSTGAAVSNTEAPIALMYDREIRYYTELAPLYKQFQDAAEIPTEDQLKFPKCYDSNKDHLKEFIIFEDLKESQFYPLDKKLEIDFEHASLSLQALGKLHALSFVFKIKEPNKFKSFTDNITELYYSEKDWIKSVNKYALKKAFDVANNATHKELLKQYETNIVDRIRDILKPDEFSVLSHSDCWLLNMMYRYKNGKPIEVRLIDYQLARYGSPAIDVLLFIFACTDQTLRHAHYEDMLRTYHNSMKSHLKVFSYEIEEYYPWTKFQDDLHSKSLVALSAGLTYILGRNTLYKERVNGILEDLSTYGYLSDLN